jgi:hypothetical protein
MGWSGRAPARQQAKLAPTILATRTDALSEIDAKLLMNHAIPGVNTGYITRHKLLEDHLRSQQQSISSAVFAALGPSIAEIQALHDWLGRGATRRAIPSVQIKPPDCDPEHVTMRQAA